MAFEPGNKIVISWIIRLLGQGGAEERLGMKLVMSLVVTFAAICSFAYTETVDSHD